MKHTPYLATFIHLRGSLFTYVNRKIFAIYLNMLNMTFSTHTLAIYTNTKLAGVGLRFIERLKMETVKLLGGHFSCRVTKHQINWLPCCEGEVLIGKLVVEHFAPFLSENRNRVIHHTDNMPTVQGGAEEKSQKDIVVTTNKPFKPLLT